MSGDKYFIYFISLGNKFTYIDTDIRKLIWKYVNEDPFIICNLIHDLTMRLTIKIKS